MALLPRARLAQLIRRELERPDPEADLAALIAGGAAEERPLAEFLRAKEQQRRAHWFLAAEGQWLKKLTWRLIRPLLVVGALAALAFGLQRALDPTIGMALFAAGAASFYVTVQFFAHLWAQGDAKKVAQIDQQYRDRLQALLAEIDRQ
ncbi:MAG TPA: hypothetical protein VGB99_10825 [Acidobacteriota bacterium]